MARLDIQRARAARETASWSPTGTCGKVRPATHAARHSSSRPMTASIAARRSSSVRGRGVQEMMIGLTRSHGVKGAAGAHRSREGRAEGVEARQPADAHPDMHTGASRRARGSRAVAATGPRACARLRCCDAVQDHSAPRPAPPLDHIESAARGGGLFCVRAARMVMLQWRP